MLVNNGYINSKFFIAINFIKQAMVNSIFYKGLYYQRRYFIIAGKYFVGYIYTIRKFFVPPQFFQFNIKFQRFHILPAGYYIIF